MCLMFIEGLVPWLFLVFPFYVRRITVVAAVFAFNVRISLNGSGHRPLGYKG